MKNDIILVMKGFLIGIAKVLPGVSGGLLAVSLGIYEQAVESISYFFKDPKRYIYFLGKIGLGVLMAIILCSKLVLYLLNHFYIPTMFLFVGLITGGIPSLFKKFNFRLTKNKGIILLIFFLFLLLSNYVSLENYVYHNTLMDHFYLFILGYLDAITMVIPGISGTLVFIILGVYEFIMYVFGNLFELMLKGPDILVFIGLGLGSGIYITSLFMSRLFHKHTDFAYTIITGFMISSLYLLLSKTLSQITNIYALIFGILCFAIGYYISSKLE